MDIEGLYNEEENNAKKRKAAEEKRRREAMPIRVGEFGNKPYATVFSKTVRTAYEKRENLFIFKAKKT